MLISKNSNYQIETEILNTKRILYIQPFETYSGYPPIFSLAFPRISNYLNSRKSELNGKIEEEYLDLRFEGLPKYIPENINQYRIALKGLLDNIHKRFKFDIVAISCLTSFTYLNCIEVASMIKHFNPNICVVTGGFHVSVLPEDFYPENIPHFEKYYSNNTSPFDFLILEEGEKTFFYLIKDLFEKTKKIRKNLKNKPFILNINIIKNLEELPLIDLEIYRKYKDYINEFGLICIEFNRGCPHRCRFCPVSERDMLSYRIFRKKSISKCIEEIKIILDTEWLSLKKISIVDAIFFPERNSRDKFFEELNKLLIEKNKPINFNINDRIDLCSVNDLENYRKYHITANFGFESGSSKFLNIMDKVVNRAELSKEKKISNFLGKAIEIIETANRLELEVIFYYLIGVPSTDLQIINENRSFLFEPRYNGESLVQKYKINFHFSKYSLLPGSFVYKNGEIHYGATFHCKDWWKQFDKDQYLFSAIVTPSRNMSFNTLIESSIEDVKKIFKAQYKLKNLYYNPLKWMSFYKRAKQLLLLYKNLE